MPRKQRCANCGAEEGQLSANWLQGMRQMGYHCPKCDKWYCADCSTSDSLGSGLGMISKSCPKCSS